MLPSAEIGSHEAVTVQRFRRTIATLPRLSGCSPNYLQGKLDLPRRRRRPVNRAPPGNNGGCRVRWNNPKSGDGRIQYGGIVDWGFEIGAVKDCSVRGGLLRASFQLTPEEVSEEVLDGMEAKFGVERDLQLALRANIGQLEEDIRIAHGGKEQVVPSAELTSSPWTHKRCVWSLNSRPAPPTGMRSARFCRRRAGLSICQKGVD